MKFEGKISKKNKAHGTVDHKIENAAEIWRKKNKSSGTVVDKNGNAAEILKSPSPVK